MTEQSKTCPESYRRIQNRKSKIGRAIPPNVLARADKVIR